MAGRWYEDIMGPPFVVRKTYHAVIEPNIGLCFLNLIYSLIVPPVLWVVCSDPHFLQMKKLRLIGSPQHHTDDKRQDLKWYLGVYGFSVQFYVE